eukprot:345830_1
MSYNTNYEKVLSVTQYVGLNADLSATNYNPQFRLRYNKGIIVPLQGKCISSPQQISLSKVLNWQISNEPKKKSKILMRGLSIEEAWNVRVSIATYNDKNDPEAYILNEWESKKSDKSADRSWIANKATILKNEKKSNHKYLEKNWKKGWNTFNNFLLTKTKKKMTIIIILIIKKMTVIMIILIQMIQPMMIIILITIQMMK